MYRDRSEMSYRRQYRGEALQNLYKIRERRNNNSINRKDSNQTLPKFTRPYSQQRLTKTKGHNSLQKISTQKKMYNKLSNQLKQIQQSIADIAQRRKKKPSKYKEKVITQISHADPKNKIYQQVLNQIKEIKKNRYQKQPQIKVPKSPQKPIQIDVAPKQPRHPNQKTLFYGVDFIQGIQFKIKILLGRQKYYLMAKNSDAKLMLQMDTKEYLKLHQNQFNGNPCKILKHLVIDQNRLRLKRSKNRQQSQSIKSYIGYY